MNKGSDEETPHFKMPDYGVYTGEQNPRVDVPARLPKTQPIPMFPPSYPPKGYADETPEDMVTADEDAEGEQESGEDEPKYSFRRHWREPLLRVLPTPYSPKAYLWLLVLSILVLAAATGAYAATGNNPALLAGCAVAVSLASYPIAREVYRWKERVVTMYLTETGVRIVYREPDNLFFGFNGDGNGNVTVLEGSTEFNSRINWPNKLVFWGCGDLFIAGKVESGGSPLLENVPHIKQVRAFLNQSLYS